MKRQNISFLVYIVSLLTFGIFFWNQLHGVVINNNAKVSIEPTAYLPAEHINNRLSGFGVLQSGFELENINTACSIGLYFPISGAITLNGGTLNLTRDMLLRGPLSFGAGHVNGNDFAIEFPRNVSVLELPASEYTKRLELIAQTSVGKKQTAIGWSYDDSYLAVTNQTGDKKITLDIFTFKETLDLLESKEIDDINGIQTLCWHPLDNILSVVGKEKRTISVFEFDSRVNTLRVLAELTHDSVQEICWSPDGNYLAVSGSILVDKKRRYGVRIYQWKNDSFTPLGYTLLDAGFKPTVGLLSWSSTNKYVAVGAHKKKNEGHISIFHFDGYELNSVFSQNVANTINTFSWHVNKPLIAIGFSGSKVEGALYRFDGLNKGLIKLFEFSSPEVTKFHDVAWLSDGLLLGCVLSGKNKLYSLHMFAISPSENTVTIVAKQNFSHLLQAISSCKIRDRFAVLDVTGNLSIFDLSPAKLVFENTKLFFDSDVIITSPIVFQGNCIVNGGNNIIDLAPNGSIKVASDSNLVLEHAVLSGIADENIFCQSDSSQIMLRDVVWLQGSKYLFSKGKMCFKSKVEMIGDGTFVYQSGNESTVMERSVLILDNGITFSYDPINSASRDLFTFKDCTSQLVLKSASLHATTTGMRLKKGKIKIRGNVNISSDSQRDNLQIKDVGGITIGTGNSLFDCKCVIDSGSSLNLIEGAFVYNNVEPNAFQMTGKNSLIWCGPETSLCLYNNLKIDGGSIVFDNNAKVLRAKGKRLVGTIHTRGNLGFQEIKE